MNKQDYVVYYNAIRTEYATYLFAFGWNYEDGWTPHLRKVEGPNNFQFELEKPSGGASIEVITPFSISEEIPENPKSIQVKDDYNSYQIQLNPIKAVGSGRNTPGKWVVSKKNK